jgi:hypothetical protein
MSEQEPLGRDEPVSINLDTETALCALLAVDPNGETDDEGD